MSSPTRALIVLAALMLGAAGALADPAIISRWTFDDGGAVNAVAGAPSGTVQKARPTEGHAGKALGFEDWSAKNYLKPDPRIATRVSIPHDPKLNPPFPFRVTAWIYPTADPIFYGGIVEKGHGYGASYRLVLLRGLRVEASLGDQRNIVRSPSPVALNAWHEVTMVADGKTLALLVDGSQVAQVNLAAAARPGSTETLTIGERFTGRIDDVSITTD